MKNQWRVIVGVILVFIIVLFAVLNSQSVPVSFGFTKITGPLILIIIISAILGFTIGLLTSIGTILKQKKTIKELKEELKDYQINQKQSMEEKQSYENTTESFQKVQQTDSDTVGSRFNHK